MNKFKLFSVLFFSFVSISLFSQKEESDESSFSDNFFKYKGSGLAYGHYKKDIEARLYNYSYEYGLRINLGGSKDDFSLGLEVTPAVGFYVMKVGRSDLYGYVGVTAPVALSMNIGAGSTYNSTKDNGFVIKAGIQPEYAPFFGDIPSSYDKFKLIPFAHFGFRKWSTKVNSVREFYLRIGMVPNNILGLDGLSGYAQIGTYKFIDY